MAWNFLAQAGIALAPWAIEMLLDSGLQAETFIDPKTGKKKTRPAADAATLQKSWDDALKAEKGNQRAAAKRFSEQWGKYRGAKNVMKSRMGLGGKLIGGTGAAATTLFLAQMLFPNAFMPDMPGMDEMAAGGMGGEGPEDLMQLLSGLEGQVSANKTDLYEDMSAAREAARMMDLQKSMDAPLSGRYNPTTAGLEEIIRGNEELIGRIAHREQPSLAQILAMEGIY